MKTLHLTPSVGPLAGGLGVVTLSLVRQQRASGCEATIWCSDSPSAAATAAAELAVEGAVREVPIIGPRVLAFSRAGERLAMTAHFDVVHQHGIWTAQARMTHIFRARGIPTIVAPHGSLALYARKISAWKKRIAMAWFESNNLRMASCLHATAEEEVRTFRDFGLRAPIAIVPNGVLPSWLTMPANGRRFREQHAIGENQRMMLFVSRLHPIKGLPLLIESLALNRDRLQGWCVVIAGQEERGHRAEVEALANRRGISGMLRFVGPIYGQEKRDAFAAAELFVLPTHSENFAIVIAEALGAGVPVITTHGAPWRDLETHRCGWWVPVDCRAIGEALVAAAARTGEELRTMGERGRELVASRYNWRVSADRTIKLYRWLLGEISRPDFVVAD